MNHATRSTLPRRGSGWMLLMLVLPLVTTGCVSLTGPNKIRNQIAQQEDVKLEKEFGITVGPLAVALADAVASNHIPFDVSGISWVDYGEYHVRRNAPSAERFCLRNLELPGWERIARVCERDEEFLVMIRAKPKLRELLFVQRERETVRIVRAEGDLERVLDVGCGMRDAGCGMRDAGCGMRDAGCGMRDAGCGMRDAGCGMRDAGCGMRDAGCGMRDAGCGMRDAARTPAERWSPTRKWRPHGCGRTSTRCRPGGPA